MDIPNIHPPLVHFPIALLIVGSTAGLLYLHIMRRTELRTLTWWSIFIGWPAVLLAILSGLVDQRAIAPDAPFRPLLNRHIGSGLALFVLYGWLLYQRRLFNTNKARRRRGDQASLTELLDYDRARVWLTVVLVLGILLVITSGWNGGRLVYEWGVNVEMQP